VLQSAGTDRHLLKSVKKRKVTYVGHKMRKKDKFLKEKIIQGIAPGARTRADWNRAGWATSDSGWAENGGTVEDG